MLRHYRAGSSVPLTASSEVLLKSKPDFVVDSHTFTSLCICLSASTTTVISTARASTTPAQRANNAYGNMYGMFIGGMGNFTAPLQVFANFAALTDALNLGFSAHHSPISRAWSAIEHPSVNLPALLDWVINQSHLKYNHSADIIAETLRLPAFIKRHAATPILAHDVAAARDLLEAAARHIGWEATAARSIIRELEARFRAGHDLSLQGRALTLWLFECLSQARASHTRLDVVMRRHDSHTLGQRGAALNNVDWALSFIGYIDATQLTRTILNREFDHAGIDRRDPGRRRSSGNRGRGQGRGQQGGRQSRSSPNRSAQASGARNNRQPRRNSSQRQSPQSGARSSGPRISFPANSGRRDGGPAPRQPARAPLPRDSAALGHRPRNCTRQDGTPDFDVWQAWFTAKAGANGADWHTGTYCLRVNIGIDCRNRSQCKFDHACGFCGGAPHPGGYKNCEIYRGFR